MHRTSGIDRVMPSRPRSETELLQRARSLAGRTIAEVATTLQVDVPPDLRRAKGWVGGLIERALGASSGSKPEPDFPELGVEVKSIPIGADGRPLESTHVCAIAMDEAAGACWEKSLARRKLARVLWVPVAASPAIALAARRIGQAVLWSPSPEQEEQLRRDWEELMELIALGRAGEVRGEMGVCLQVRPKAASGSARTRASNSEGEMNAGLPLGFYLRPAFTARILVSSYAGLSAPDHD